MLPLAGTLFFALDVPWLRRLELIAFDVQMRLRGARAPGRETVIVMIDDATIAALGRWPLPRQSLADAVTLLRRAGAKTIGIDILLADRESRANDSASHGETRGDAMLARAIGDAGNVVLPYAFQFGTAPRTSRREPAPLAYARLFRTPDHRPLSLKPTGLVMPLAALAEPAILGHMQVAYDIDGAPRFEYPALEFDLDFYPSMAVRVAQHYLGVPWNAVSVELGRGIALGSIRVPTDPSMRLLVDYLGPSPAFPTYGLADVLDGKVPAAVFRDRIVLLGANALGTRDTFVSPFTAVMPGVERLATVVDSIVHQRHVRRPPVAPWAEAAFMAGVAVAMGVAVSRLSLALAALCGVALVAGFAVAGQFALARFGIWQASAVPVLAVLATFIGLALYRYGLLDKERRHIRRLFQRYLAPSMVDRVVNSPKLPELGGELRELTVLFCDLRGFTALSERLDPAALTRVINAFLQAATDAVLAHGGTVDKYVGDAIMAFWNAPLDQEDHPTLACRAALGIRARVRAIDQAALSDAGLPRLDAGVGINTGLCTVGNFGSAHRFDYSAVGDAVNVAARLESESRAHDMAILLGPETAARVRGLTTRALGSVHLRGRAEALEICALVEDDHLSQPRA